MQKKEEQILIGDTLVKNGRIMIVGTNTMGQLILLDKNMLKDKKFML